jgi:hypothetical protein
LYCDTLSSSLPEFLTTSPAGILRGAIKLIFVYLRFYFQGSPKIKRLLGCGLWDEGRTSAM